MRCVGCPMAGHAAPCLGERQPGWCDQSARGPGQSWHVRFASLMAAGLVAEAKAERTTMMDPAVARGAALPVGFPTPRRPSDRRVRVGILSPCCYLGGAEKWISDLLDLCDGSRLDWAGIGVLMPPGAAPSLMADWQRHCPVAIGWRAMAALARQVDVLLTWGVLDVSWGLPPSMIASIVPAGVPIVTVSHCSVEFPPRDPQGLVEAVPVAVSRAALRGLPEPRRPGARIILNAVEPARVARTRSRAEMLAAWGLPADAKVAGWLGRLSAEKGPDRFIRGIAALPAGWSGVMVGWGLDEARYREQAGREAPGRVVFAGPAEGPGVGDALGAFDCLVMASDFESCSIALAEAWLAGVPAVSPPVGMLEEHPGFARLTPSKPGGPEIAAAILADRADPVGTAARVETARRFVAAEMAPGAFGAAWTGLLCGLAPPPEVGPELCDCGDDVWVGSKAACVAQRPRFRRIIHIYRDDKGGTPCRADAANLSVHWREWEPVEPIEMLRPGLAEVMAFAREPGRLLVHCQGGVTRSTTLAVAAKVARGCDPDRAVRDVEAAMLRDRKIPVAWHQDIVRGMVEGFRADRATVVARSGAAQSIDPAIRDAVNACPHRGGELPVSIYANEGCCSGPTRWGCSAGKGKVPGQPTLRDCCRCVGG